MKQLDLSQTPSEIVTHLSKLYDFVYFVIGSIESIYCKCSYLLIYFYILTLFIYILNWHATNENLP